MMYLYLGVVHRRSLTKCLLHGFKAMQGRTG